METLKYWVWITQALGPANRRIWEIIRQYKDITEAYDSITGGNFTGITPKEISSFKKAHIEQAEKLIEYCNTKGINVICYDDEDNFPNRLREIYNPPTVLYCYGDISYIDNSVALGVVGAREPSEYSIKVAETICTELAKVGTVLISGFAYGIDSIAHKSALKNNTKTIAVLGCGIDYDYPKENAKMKRVLAQNGAVISEYSPGTRPFHDYFRQRNRLISALSLGVLIVEASTKSGSLNTANHALQQGKDIFCIPPRDIFNEKYCGVVSLIRDGAIPVFSHLDIMYEYYENFSHRLADYNMFDEYFLNKPELNETKVTQPKHKSVQTKNSTTSQDVNINEETEKSNIDYSQLTDIQSRIVKLLEERAMLADEITAELDMDISEVLSELTELELFGYIKALAGKRYSL